MNEFLKPTKGKIIIFLIFLIPNIALYFYTPKCFGSYCPFDGFIALLLELGLLGLFDKLGAISILQNYMLLFDIGGLIIWYLISCIIVFLYNAVFKGLQKKWLSVFGIIVIVIMIIITGILAYQRYFIPQVKNIPVEFKQ